MKNRRQKIAAVVIAAASILLSFGTIAHAVEQRQCTTETGSFSVTGKGGKALNCKSKETCLVKVIEGSCQKFFGCKQYWTTTYSNCEAAASRVPPTKVLPKVTPSGAEPPATKSPKVPPTGGIQRN